MFRNNDWEIHKLTAVGLSLEIRSTRGHSGLVRCCQDLFSSQNRLLVGFYLDSPFTLQTSWVAHLVLVLGALLLDDVRAMRRPSERLTIPIFTLQ
jgi:hypothetical protein